MCCFPNFQTLRQFTTIKSKYDHLPPCSWSILYDLLVTRPGLWRGTAESLDVRAVERCNSLFWLQVEAGSSCTDAFVPQISVTIPAREGNCSRVCTICFGYFEEMNAVLAHSPTHPELLAQFDLSDTGCTWPHEVTPVHRDGGMAPEVPTASKPFRCALSEYCSPAVCVGSNSVL